jgi:hypothetical protein
LAAAGGLAFDDCREYTDKQEHGAAAEVADQVQGWHWPVTLASDRVQEACQTEVVDVVAGASRADRSGPNGSSGQKSIEG